MNEETALRLDSVNIMLGETVVLNRVSFSIDGGEIMALVGPNGSGKTALLEAVFGSEGAYAGNLALLGTALCESRPTLSVQAQCELLPSKALVFPDLTVKENMLVGCSVSQSGFIDRFRELGFLHAVLTPHLNRKARTLSGGMQKLAGLASVMIRSPRLALLDEPSAGLSFQFTERMFESLREYASKHGCAMIVADHAVPELCAVADQLCVLRDRQIAYLGPVPKGSAGNGLCDELFGTSL